MGAVRVHGGHSRARTHGLNPQPLAQHPGGCAGSVYQRRPPRADRRTLHLGLGCEHAPPCSRRTGRLRTCALVTLRTITAHCAGVPFHLSSHARAQRVQPPQLRARARCGCNTSRDTLAIRAPHLCITAVGSASVQMRSYVARTRVYVLRIPRRTAFGFRSLLGRARAAAVAQGRAAAAFAACSPGIDLGPLLMRRAGVLPLFPCSGIPIPWHASLCFGPVHPFVSPRAFPANTRRLEPRKPAALPMAAACTAANGAWDP